MAEVCDEYHPSTKDRERRKNTLDGYGSRTPFSAVQIMQTFSSIASHKSRINFSRQVFSVPRIRNKYHYFAFEILPHHVRFKESKRTPYFSPAAHSSSYFHNAIEQWDDAHRARLTLLGALEPVSIQDPLSMSRLGNRAVTAMAWYYRQRVSRILYVAKICLVNKANEVLYFCCPFSILFRYAL